MTPLFSIITVCRNASAVIGATLRSVAAQAFADYEYLVQDGASTDTTLDVVAAAGINTISVVSERDSGIYDAMNRAIRRARGRYLIFLNAGDAFHSADTLSSVAAAIQTESYPGVVYGQTDIVGADGKRIGPRHLTAPQHLDAHSFKKGMLVCHQAFVVRRDIAPMYDLRYRLSADFDWCIRCLQRSEANVFIDAVLIDYLSEGETTRHHRASLRERYNIMCRYYGTFPTVLRHIGFVFRSLKRKLK